MVVPEALIERAEEAQEKAYNPYSDYAVGAALEDKHGQIWTACNMENAAYTPTTHAEQTAFSKAISDNVHEGFVHLAIVTEGRDGGAPCGLCRQVIREFASDDFKVYSATEDGYEEYTLGEILPESFGPENIEAIQD